MFGVRIRTNGRELMVEGRGSFRLLGRLGAPARAEVTYAEAPYGVDSGWQAALGFGLRIGLPNGTRNAWRVDLAFPVGGDTSQGPVFRVNLELNRLRSGFSTPDVVRSHRFRVGAETF